MEPGVLKFGPKSPPYYRVDQRCKTFKYSPQTISDERPESPNSPRHTQDLAPNAASFLTAPGHYWGRKPLGSRRNWPLEVGRGSKGRQETALHCNSIKKTLYCITLNCSMRHQAATQSRSSTTPTTTPTAPTLTTTSNPPNQTLQFPPPLPTTSTTTLTINKPSKSPHSQRHTN